MDLMLSKIKTTINFKTDGNHILNQKKIRDHINEGTNIQRNKNNTNY